MGFPKLFFDNRFADAVPVASSTAAGNFAAANLMDMRAYTWWKSNVMNANVTVDCGAAKAADYGLIYGHDLFTQGATVEFRGSNDNFAVSNAGTAQAAASKSLTLAATANATDDFYKNGTVRVTSGAGARQERPVLTSRKNHLSYSRTFGSWVNNSAPVIADAIVASDGTLTADKISDDATSTEHYRELTITEVSNQIYTVSVEAHAGDTATFVLCVIAVGSSSTTSFIPFSVSGGVISAGGVSGIVSAATSTLIIGGWYLCTCTYTLNGTVTSHRARFYPKTSGGYIGTGQGTYFWEAKVELGSVATERIHTEGLAAVGVSVAPWSSNMITNSNLPCISGFSATVSTVSVLHPDGTYSDATLVTPNKVAGNHYATSRSVAAFITGTTYTVQFLVQPNGYIYFHLHNNGNYNGRCIFNCTGAGSYTNLLAPAIAASITAVSNGGYLCTMTFVAAAIAEKNFYCSPTPTGSFSFTGDGISGMYFLAMQVEPGSVATPNITTGATPIALPDATSVYEVLLSDTLLASRKPSSNDPILLEWTSASYRYWRMMFIGPTNPSVAVALLGAALTMPQYMPVGFDPLKRRAITQSNSNDNGHPLGKIIDYEQYKQTLAFKNVPWAWLRDNWQPAWESNVRGAPFVFAWDSQNYPNEIYLVTAGDDYSTPHQAGSLAALSFDVSGVAK